MEKIASQLPQGIGYEWTGLSFQEKLAGSQAPALLSIALVVVFLLLVALYVGAGRLAPGSYGEEMGLVELVGLSAALGGAFVLLPAALGIARGSALRRASLRS